MPKDRASASYYEKGEQISAVVTVQKTAAEVYDAWAGLSGLPRFIEELDVVARAGTRALWKGNSHGESFEWESEVLNEEPNRLIAWKASATAPVQNAGSVTLKELPYRRGTEVRVVIDYVPPRGAVADRVNKMMRGDPEELLRIAMFRFRQWMETGEIATTRGQPSARKPGRDEEGSKDEKKIATSAKEGR
ncbi:MAG TPA: SRPBCC family protein [Phycisphaerales bacterium]|nr:SRPBCC family protein [Phycisphaerales bacterium]